METLSSDSRSASWAFAARFACCLFKSVFMKTVKKTKIMKQTIYFTCTFYENRNLRKRVHTFKNVSLPMQSTKSQCNSARSKSVQHLLKAKNMKLSKLHISKLRLRVSIIV